MFTKPSRQVTRIFLHCTASDVPAHDNVAAIRKYHTDPAPAGKGWSDIGYNLFIRKSGRLENARDLEKTPAAQKGHNTKTIAICLHGKRKDKFTKAQFDTLKELCIEINKAYNGAVTFHGHCEVANKACPVFDYKKLLKLNDYGILGLGGAVKAKPKKMTKIDDKELPDLKEGDTGPAVEFLQELLFIRVDGIFGTKTSRAVKDFKEEHDLYRSDLVVSHVWRLLLARDHVDHFDE